MVGDIVAHPEYRDSIVSFVKDNGGLDYAMEQLEKYVDDAVLALSVLPDSVERSYLIELAHFTAKRNM